MFRNPRENGGRGVGSSVLPSTGRPPTPPHSKETTTTARSPYFASANDFTKNPTSSPAASTSVLGRRPLSSTKKSHSKSNHSILKFFGKAEKTVSNNGSVNGPISEDAGLFFEHASQTSPLSPPKRNSFEDEVASRFNEVATPSKKRRLDGREEDDSFVRTPSPERRGQITTATPIQTVQITQKARKSRGGFVDESSDEEENPDKTHEPDAEEPRTVMNTGRDGINEPEDGLPDDFTERQDDGLEMVEVVETIKIPLKPPGGVVEDRELEDNEHTVPALHREGTSAFAAGEFDDEDFDDEFFPEGEEYMERKFMEEQREMERAFEDDSKSESGTEGARTPRNDREVELVMHPTSAVSTCPMCGGNMTGLSEHEASSHVNACLDGTAKPLPSPVGPASEAKKSSNCMPPSQGIGPKRFQRAAIARPGQANPFSQGSKDDNTKSAFSRLMSGHAEDAAWAEAATNEVQSRGKAAYQRTCPFYKIMPGLHICVDAFRYGKVEGQNAYFLSHFHSDHYIGLTSQWCHGPIYASKVTCNLMRQQLRVDPKWIVPLEFEKKIEVPSTNGVFVTMLPANHCPGSSLYLFEKVIGKNRDGGPKLTRILHCGDFRACPAHVNHPLLVPDILDSVSGQTRQQVIDTCYLDTTYLTPKYAFPGQYDVIDACAQMCVSLSKEIVDTTDDWETAKAERAGSTMQKFLEQGSHAVDVIKREDDADEGEGDIKPKVRGRLLVVIGTYSIGKERICLGIAHALGSKIYAPPAKMRICKALEDAELSSLLTSNPLEAQVHMQMLMEIRAETLQDYLTGLKPHFSRIVGFRPTGWSYRPPTSRFTENPAVSTVLHSESWKSRFTMRDLVPQRGSTRESHCFGVPYSEHSSFRELAMFCCALRINRVIPTVNVGSAKSREKMKAWIEKWDAEKRKNGLFRVESTAEGWGSGDGKLRYGV